MCITSGDELIQPSKDFDEGPGTGALHAFFMEVEGLPFPPGLFYLIFILTGVILWHTEGGDLFLF